MVVFNDNAVQDRTAHTSWLRSQFGQDKAHIKNEITIGSLIGYSGTLSKEALQAVLDRPEVKYVEVDQSVSV